MEGIAFKNIYKDIIIDSLQFLVREKWITLNGFVIMSNHIHLIWQTLNEFTPSRVQSSFMKYTSQQLLRLMATDVPETIAAFKVNKGDRDQIWKREPLGVDLFTPEVFSQKLNYIPVRPVIRAGIIIR